MIEGSIAESYRTDGQAVEGFMATASRAKAP
jgi:hypothetical protein